MVERNESLPDKLEIFPSGEIPEEESAELAEISHAELLAEAFVALTNEFDTHGNTQKFQELTGEYAGKILAFWNKKIEGCEEVLKEGLTKEAKWEIGEDEKIAVREKWINKDTKILEIKRRTATEDDEILIAVNKKTGLADESIQPTTINSEISPNPNQPPDIFYKVVLRGGNISTFGQILIKSDPEQKRPHIKNTRIIDCSILG